MAKGPEDRGPKDKADGGPKGLANGLTNYGDNDFSLYLRRSFAGAMGYTREIMDRPVVGICSSPSNYNACHRHMPELVEAVKRGVLAAGGLPMDFPTISLGETFLNPTSLMYRNLMSMDVEEMIRAQPMDAAVVIGGCDKTLPAQLMGAANAEVPVIALISGPMMTSPFDGERLGACTDCRRFWAKYRAGEIDDATINRVEGRLATTAGTCAVMGTASTMACITETLGMALPGTAAIPAVHADRLRAAEYSGRRAFELALAGRGGGSLPRQVVTDKAVENALRVLLAVGGSTNAIVHLTAIAGRLGIDIDLNRLNRLSDETPVLIDLKPTGEFYMEDLFAAGGLGAILRELKPLLHLDCPTVAGETLGERLDREAGAYVDRRWCGPSTIPSRRKAAWSRCSAIWRRAAPSSNARPPTPACSRARGGRSCLARSTIWRRASTTRIWMSGREITWSCKTPGPARRRPCPRPAICRSRANWRPPGLRTWCAFPTPA